MELNPELLKKVLEWCEDNLPKGDGVYPPDIIIESYSKEEIKLHVKLLSDAGYISHHSTPAKKGGVSKEGAFRFSVPSYTYIDNLSLNGYQYLKLLKSPAWNKAKSLLHETGVIFAEAAIKALIEKINFNQ
jgi:hypothetical protein